MYVINLQEHQLWFANCDVLQVVVKFLLYVSLLIFLQSVKSVLYNSGIALKTTRRNLFEAIQGKKTEEEVDRIYILVL